MRVSIAAILLAAAASASAQAVVGTPYGFAKGVTGGGDAAAVTPTSNDELADLLSDDTARVIYLNQEFDFTGKKATGAGCDRKSCSADNGGQLYLGDLSCGGSDNVAVSSVSYDEAGTSPLVVGSNKSIIGNGKGVIRGKGLRLAKNAKNIIIQGIELTEINPGVVWGGDAIDFQGGNDGVWVDHCKISLVGRMFIVSHYDASRMTISNNEFDGVTTTSASCNSNHYWTMMFYGDGDQVTLDRNYFHDVSGRAPKLGQDGVKGTFQASNNYFANMKGHAFDAYSGASALIEGNVFENVQQPTTNEAAKISTLYTVPDSSAASACSSVIGRACEVNSVGSGSGELASLKDTSALSALADAELVKPVAATEVKALVQANAGPSKVGASGASSGSSETVEEEVAAPTTTAEAEAPAASTPAAEEPVAEAPATTTPVAEAPAATEAPSSGSGSGSSSGTVELYGQCGGQGYSGATECVSGATCLCMNAWYSQCLSSSAKFQSSC